MWAPLPSAAKIQRHEDPADGIRGAATDEQTAQMGQEAVEVGVLVIGGRIVSFLAGAGPYSLAQDDDRQGSESGENMRRNWSEASGADGRPYPAWRTGSASLMTHAPYILYTLPGHAACASL